MRIRESDVVAAVFTWLEEDGFAPQLEYPILGKVADVFAVASGGGRVVAVECKERDWRRAVRQARLYQLAAEHVYVALPGSCVTEKVSREMAHHGLGLIGVTEDGGVVILLDPRSSQGLMESLRNRAAAQFQKRQQGAVSG